MAVEINYSQILEDRSSFQVVRTNPKLTGNVKFTIDGNDNMWLNSIDANDELSKDLYKRVAIDPTISLSGNMFRFFNNGTTPNDIVFDLKESFDNTKTSTDFKDQYDFANYFSGAKYLVSKRYDERMSYFAPMYLKKDVPDFFVIFKIDDPINKNIEDLKNEYPFNREEYIKELFKKSSIIKTFDIRRTTKVGKYIRDYIESEQFPTSPLNVSYQKGELTEWNGIMFNSGVMGSRGELLNDFYSTSAPLKRFEEFITGGYERNGIILPNLINFEFIFNDDSSELYDFNRYLGVYINAIELSKLDIDLERAYSERGTWENTPAIRTPYKEWDTDRVTQSNKDGVIIPAKNSGILFSDFENIFQDKSNMFFNYISDKDSNIYLPKLDSPYSIDYEGTTELTNAKIRLSNTDIELSKFYGPGEVFLQDEGFSSNVSGFSHSYINVDKLSHLDEIKVYHLNGTRSDAKGRYDSIIGTSGYSVVPNPGDFYVYNDFDNVAGFDTFYFNIDGSDQQTIRALVGCLNGIRSSRFEALAFNEFAFIRLKVPSDSDAAYSLEFNSPTGVYDSVVINDTSGSDLIGTLIPFEGGSRSNKNRLIISEDHYNKIVDNFDDILVKTKTGWSKIKKVSKYIDEILEKNSTTDVDRRNSISSFFDNIAIVLEQDEEPEVKFKNFMMRSKHRPSFGLLSFFPIKDFDFDFYSSEYLNFPIIDLYKHYFIPPNIDILQEDSTYKLVGTGQIRYPSGTGDIYPNNDPSGPNTGRLVYVPSGGSRGYDVVSGSPFLVFDNSGVPGSLDDFVEIEDENEEFLNFEGFFTVKDPDKVVPESNDLSFSLRTKYINGLANSEYEFYKENENLDFALRSKMIPYITKWSATDGTDSRSNPYRLNSELPFGFNNFSPDHEDLSQNPSNFTHEWFYIESDFNYSESEDTTKLNNSYFDESFDLTRAQTEEGYFTDYFTYTPSFGGEEIAETQTRYSPINKNAQGIYEALFKGFKISFKDFIDANNIDSSGKPEFNPNSNRFEDYKFAAILKPLVEDIDNPNQPPIRYRLIEHKDFKYILLLIEIRLGDVDSIDSIWQETGKIEQYRWGGPIGKSKAWGQLVDGGNGFIYAPPENTTNVLKFDPINKTKVGLFGGFVPSDDSQYRTASIAPNGKIYCAPHNASAVLVIDPSTDTYVNITAGVPAGTFKYIDSDTSPNGIQYAVSYNTGDILKIDTNTDTVSTLFSGLNPQGDIIYASNGYMYIFDRDNGGNISKLDPITDTLTVIGSNQVISGNFHYRNMSAEANGFIYFTEFKSAGASPTDFYKLNLLTDAITPISYPTGVSSDNVSCVLERDGLIYFIIIDGVLELDPTTDTLTELTGSFTFRSEDRPVVFSGDNNIYFSPSQNYAPYDSIPEIRFTDSSPVNSSNFLSSIGAGGTLAYDTINGDYRFDFNGDLVSDLTYAGLYSIRNKKYNNKLNRFSNIKLSSIINISSSGVNLPSVTNLTIDAISNYPSNLSDEINQPTEDNFVIGKDLTTLSNKFIDYSPTFTPLNVSKLISATENSIVFSVTSDLKLISDNNIVEAGIPTGLNATYYKNNYVNKILSGGKLYYETLFEKISFAGFKRYVNELNPFIEYESYSYDGTTLSTSDLNWFCEIPDTSSIIKKSAILAVEDTNKPSNAAFNQVVGYTYESTELDNTYEINRYDGGFSPLFKNVFTFNSKFKFVNNDIKDLDLSNTLFNINIDKFLNIQNFNHIKIANNKILSLEADSEFDPQYELIDEIAIGREDYDLLSSNWDYGFHYRYSDKKLKNPVSGTLRIEEDETFISKLINLRPNIELENYDLVKVDNLASVNIDDIEIAYTENENTVEGIINIENVITSFLLSDGIADKFNEFLKVGPEFIGNFETIEDYIKDYVAVNILRLYEIEEVEFFEKEDKTLVEDTSNTNINAIEFRFLTDKERFNLGYKPNKNLEINKSKRLILTFNFSKRLNSGLLISPKVKIKFI